MYFTTITVLDLKFNFRNWNSQFYLNFEFSVFDSVLILSLDSQLEIGILSFDSVSFSVAVFLSFVEQKWNLSFDSVLILSLDSVLISQL